MGFNLGGIHEDLRVVSLIKNHKKLPEMSM